jgi:uncharacterized protein (TIGR03437 family)
MRTNLLRSLPLILAMQLASAAVSYTYDAAGRLIKAVYDNGSIISYTYDSAGNPISRSAVTPSAMNIASVTTAFGGSNIAQNTWIVIKGANLVPANTPAAGIIWSAAPDFAHGKMPTNLNGIGATVNGKPGFVYFFCSAATDPQCPADQINLLSPLDSTLGPVQVVVNNNGASSPPFMANMTSISPAFLLFDSSNIAAEHTDYTLLAPTSVFPNSSTPARPGETIILYGIGFGLPSDNTLTNGSSSQSGSLTPLPVCQIGGTATAPLVFAGLAGPGLYQLQVTVPRTAPNGANPVSCTYKGSATPAGGVIAVQQ